MQEIAKNKKWPVGELLCVMHSCTVVPRRQVWYASVALLQRHGLLPRDRNYLQAIEKNEFHLSPVVEVTVPQNIMVFHQLRAGEIATLFRTLWRDTQHGQPLSSSPVAFQQVCCWRSWDLEEVVHWWCKGAPLLS